MASHSACKAGKESGRTFGAVFVFPKHNYSWWSSAFLGVAEHLAVHGKLWMNSFSCTACVLLCLCFACFAWLLLALLNCLYLNPRVLSLWFSPSQCRGSWVNWLSCHLGLNSNSPPTQFCSAPHLNRTAEQSSGPKSQHSQLFVFQESCIALLYWYGIKFIPVLWFSIFKLHFSY